MCADDFDGAEADRVVLAGLHRGRARDSDGRRHMRHDDVESRLRDQRPIGDLDGEALRQRSRRRRPGERTGARVDAGAGYRVVDQAVYQNSAAVGIRPHNREA